LTRRKGLRVAVVGATGNVGTAVVEALAAEPAVDAIVGVARRVPTTSPPKTTWVAADISVDELEPAFEGADAVIHLAWRIQPSHDVQELRRTNVLGSRRVMEAARHVRAERLVVASSVGVYSPGPRWPVGEDWPRDGVPTSFYAQHKAQMERDLDAYEARPGAPRVVRLRPALIFWGPGADRGRRLFAGPFLPASAVRPALLRRLPLPRGLVVQCVHARDVADAYRRAVLADVHGAFNVAAEPPLGPRELGDVFGAPALELPPRVLRRAVSLTHALRLQPTPVGWLDLALGVPTMSTSRARDELGWTPTIDAAATLGELLDGLRSHRGGPTPPLDADAESGLLRWRELVNLVGIGQRP
jgi:nucleoside-diphosphate-sugar epimerase